MVGHSRRTTASVSDTPGCAFEPSRLREPLALPSPRVGVGHRDDEEPLAPVRRADVAGPEETSVAEVSKPFEVVDNLVQSTRHERRHVFDHDGTRSELSDDAREFAPESRARASEARAVSCQRDILAGESPTKDVGSNESCRSGTSDVGDAPMGMGPVLGEDTATERILLDLPDDGAEAGLLKPSSRPPTPENSEPIVQRGDVTRR
jgi:hypothetical protein